MNLEIRLFGLLVVFVWSIIFFLIPVAVYTSKRGWKATWAMWKDNMNRAFRAVFQGKDYTVISIEEVEHKE